MKYPLVLCLLAALPGGLAAVGAGPGDPGRELLVPAIGPATRPQEDWARTRQQVAQLTGKALELLRQNKPLDAEQLLGEALRLDPKEPVDLYDMACLKAIEGQADQAMDYLTRSAEAGFTDFAHIAIDNDLEGLRHRADFEQLIAHKDDFQRLSAERTVQTLKKMLSPGYTYEIDAKDKLILAAGADQAAVDALKKDLLAQEASQWKQLFDNKPTQYITVVIASPVDFRKLVRTPGVEGFYNAGLRTLVARGMGYVTMHEFTHALHAADIEPLGQSHPVWITEGLAVLFEHAEYEQDVLVPHDSFRLPYLQAAVRKGQLMSLERLLAMPQAIFVRQPLAMVNYAESGYLMLYLYEKNQLRLFYDTYKKHYGDDRTGRLALESATGMTLAQIDADWRQWLMRRQVPPTTGGAYSGVRFGQAVDGARVDMIVPGGPAALAKLKLGDVVIAVNDLEARDVQTLLPLLAAHRAGEQVTLKVRRGEQYMDIPLTLARRAGVGRN